MHVVPIHIIDPCGEERDAIVLLQLAECWPIKFNCLFILPTNHFRCVVKLLNEIIHPNTRPVVKFKSYLIAKKRERRWKSSCFIPRETYWALCFQTKDCVKNDTSIYVYKYMNDSLSRWQNTSWHLGFHNSKTWHNKVDTHFQDMENNFLVIKIIYFEDLFIYCIYLRLFILYKIVSLKNMKKSYSTSIAF